MKLSNIKAKVLVVDDDADIRNAIRLTLESGASGVTYSFMEAATTKSGLQALIADKPDVVILDIHMPGASGFELVNRLEKSSLLSKIIILTADGSFKNLWKAEAKGINAYHFMSKPFRNEELQALVLSMIVPKRKFIQPLEGVA